MLSKIRIFVILAIFCPTVVFGTDSSMVSQSDVQAVYDMLIELGWDKKDVGDPKRDIFDRIEKSMDTLDETMDDLKQNYEDVKANEQSLANRTLTALSTAATGIGGMELAMGLAEQKADKEADQNMTAYIETMRCTYGDGKQVKAGPDEIELPGANNEELFNLRNEYIALAADLKARKEALGMKPGIEAEEIMDKSQMGLYDDEFVGITNGTYESLYRAKMLNSETDQAKIEEMQKTSKNRVIGGAVAVGVGVIGGVVGNILINKNAPKNKSEQILNEREQAMTDLNDLMTSIVDDCNERIQSVKNSIPTKSEYNAAVLDGESESYEDYVQRINNISPLSGLSDIERIRDIPTCKD